MKAISAPQPWVWAVLVHECRVLPLPSQQRHTGEILVHASRVYNWPLHWWLVQRHGITPPQRLPRGGIVGCAEAVGVVDGDSVPGEQAGWMLALTRCRYALLVRHPRSRPRERCPGHRGIWTIPEQLSLL